MTGLHVAQAKRVLDTARTLAADPPVEQARSGNLAELCREWWRIEHRLGLIEARANGVHWWPPMRVETFYRLTRALGLFSEPQAKARRPRPPRWQKLLERARATWPLQLAPARPARYLVFPHERKIDRGDGPVDIYTERLCRELAPQDVLIVDRTPPRAANGYLSFDRLKATIRARERAAWSPTPGEQRRFQALEDALARTFGVRVPTSRIAPRRVRTFIAARQVYGALLDRLDTECVFVVVGYFKHALNAAAHDRGIQVHEFQHAAISPYSLGYSYPGRPHVPYSPDTVLCFGPFWTSVSEFPANTRPVVVGRTGALNAALAEAGPKRPRQVVVISQGVIGPELLKLAVRAALLAPDYRFVFRRHPGEVGADLGAALSAARLECPPNLAIVGSDRPFYQSLAESEVQVGVFSTGLFEGMLMGCRTIVAQLPGSEAMEAVVRRGDATVVTSPEELVESLALAPRARPDDYYAESAHSVRQLVGCRSEA
jgi:hypothetical protein